VIQHKIYLYHGSVEIVDTGVGHSLRGEKLISDLEVKDRLNIDKLFYKNCANYSS